VSFKNFHWNRHKLENNNEIAESWNLKWSKNLFLTWYEKSAHEGLFYGSPTTRFNGNRSKDRTFSLDEIGSKLVLSNSVVKIFCYWIICSVMFCTFQVFIHFWNSKLASEVSNVLIHSFNMSFILWITLLITFFPIFQTSLRIFKSFW